MLNLREGMFRAWYWYISKTDKNAQILFMNYGFSNPDSEPLKLDDDANRYSIQLYHQLTNKVEIAGKDILEIGSGRGGGLTFITKHFSPKTATGLELNQRAVNFCNEHYKHDGLSFVQGDAQKLNLADSAYDVILNVESSHRYPDFKSFLDGAYRILKPGGYLLITDFRYDYEMAELDKDIANCDLTLLKNEDITAYVVNALDLDDQRKRDLVKKLAPRFLHKKALTFSGAIGSATYNSFASREFLYFNYILQKPE